MTHIQNWFKMSEMKANTMLVFLGLEESSKWEIEVIKGH